MPGKNIRLLNGYPLIAYSIVAAVMSRRIGRVVVSTDSEEIAEISRHFGAEVPFIRPAQFAQDKSPDLDFVKHAIGWFKDNWGKAPEYLVHLRPTTPLRDPALIDSALELIAGDDTATSLRSGHPAAESPFKWFLKDERGYFRPIRSGMTNEDCNLPRQAFPPVYIPDGYVDVLKTAFVNSSNKLHGEQVIGFESPVCREVDTLEDLKYLEFEAARGNGPLSKYLAEKFKRGE